jgi:hypothetical protein
MPARCPPQRLEPLRRCPHRSRFVAMRHAIAGETIRPVSGLAGCVRMHVGRIAFPRHAVA